VGERLLERSPDVADVLVKVDVARGGGHEWGSVPLRASDAGRDE
jgi:hypothetical protein